MLDLNLLIINPEEGLHQAIMEIRFNPIQNFLISPFLSWSEVAPFVWDSANLQCLTACIRFPLRKLVYNNSLLVLSKSPNGPKTDFVFFWLFNNSCRRNSKPSNQLQIIFIFIFWNSLTQDALAMYRISKHYKIHTVPIISARYYLFTLYKRTQCTL